VQDQRKWPPEKQKHEPEEEEDEQKMREEMGLARSGRLFGGLINDIKRKTPW
jgi:sodium bicarbonate transporter 10